MGSLWFPWVVFLSAMACGPDTAQPEPPVLVAAGTEGRAPESLDAERLEAPADQPGDAAAPAAEPPAAPGTIETVDDLLDALEHAGADLRTLTASIRYTKTFALEGDDQTRLGTLYYTSDGADPPQRHFGVYWNELRVDARRNTEYNHAYIFDGEWLVEKIQEPTQKQFIKRQVVKPGERFDPLRLGEGPFPIPIGQSKRDILDRFEASMPELTEGLTTDVDRAIVNSKPTAQLHLTPRGSFKDDINLEEIRIWYRLGTMLPVLAWTLTPEGNESMVVLTQVKTNEFIAPALLETTTPREGEGWDVEISEYRGSDGGAP